MVSNTVFELIVWHALEERDKILAKADDNFDAVRFAEVEEIVLHNDGYTAEARAASILEGLGIPVQVHPNALSTLSGGFKLRVLLAQVLASQPDVSSNGSKNSPVCRNSAGPRRFA